MTATDLIAAGYRMGRKMVHGFVDDLTPEEFQKQPVPGANSAAWIVGHLAMTTWRTANRLGVTGLPPLTEEFIARFGATRKVAGEQANLGDKAELLALLDVSVEKVMEAVKTVPAEMLTGPTPIAGNFATNGAEGLLFAGMHLTHHCGQLSTIRRILGKPPLV